MSQHQLVIGISATALFDLREVDQIFRETAIVCPDKAVLEYSRKM